MFRSLKEGYHLKCKNRALDEASLSVTTCKDPKYPQCCWTGQQIRKCLGSESPSTAKGLILASTLILKENCLGGKRAKILAIFHHPSLAQSTTQTVQALKSLFSPWDQPASTEVSHVHVTCSKSWNHYSLNNFSSNS